MQAHLLDMQGCFGPDQNLEPAVRTGAGPSAGSDEWELSVSPQFSGGRALRHVGISEADYATRFIHLLKKQNYPFRFKHPQQIQGYTREEVNPIND